MTGCAGGLGVLATIAVAIPVLLIHIQMVPVHIGGDISEIEAFSAFVAEAGGDFVHGEGIAGGWGIAVGEEGIAVARSQSYAVGFAMTCETLAVIDGLITFVGGDGDIQAADCQPFGLLEVVCIGDVAVGDTIEMDAVP